MTPLELQDELVTEMEVIFKDHVYKTPKGERVPIRVFPQNIPVSETDDEEEPIPNITVKLHSGKDDGTRDSFNTISIVIVIGIWDDALDAQGYRDVMNIIQKIYERFHKNPDLNHKAAYKGDFNWILPEEGSYPYYYGACSMNFYIAAIRREDRFA